MFNIEWEKEISARVLCSLLIAHGVYDVSYELMNEIGINYFIFIDIIIWKLLQTKAMNYIIRSEINFFECFACGWFKINGKIELNGVH